MRYTQSKKKVFSKPEEQLVALMVLAAVYGMASWFFHVPFADVIGVLLGAAAGYLLAK